MVKVDSIASVGNLTSGRTQEVFMPKADAGSVRNPQEVFNA